jgi:hypothetical protein
MPEHLPCIVTTAGSRRPEFDLKIERCGIRQKYFKSVR